MFDLVHDRSHLVRPDRALSNLRYHPPRYIHAVRQTSLQLDRTGRRSSNDWRSNFSASVGSNVARNWKDARMAQFRVSRCDLAVHLALFDSKPFSFLLLWPFRINTRLLALYQLAENRLLDNTSPALWLAALPGEGQIAKGCGSHSVNLPMLTWH